MQAREEKKGLTSPPVEREDNCECLEMLRWTEAISSTNTAPASLPAPSHSLTDFLLWVFACACASVRTHYYAYSKYTISVSAHEIAA